MFWRRFPSVRLSGLPQKPVKCRLAKGLHFRLCFGFRFEFLTVTTHTPNSTPMKQCAFCLRPAKMTAEHIWSAWMGRLFSEARTFDFSDTKEHTE